MSDLLADSILYWTFSSVTGDAYSGYTVLDSPYVANLPVGTILEPAYGDDFGFYTVTNVVNYGLDLSATYGISYYIEGATVLSSYFDATTGRLVPTYYGGQGIPTTYQGLGYEYDFVPVASLAPPGFPAAGFYEVGYSGYYLIA